MTHLQRNPIGEDWQKMEIFKSQTAVKYSSSNYYYYYYYYYYHTLLWA